MKRFITTLMASVMLIASMATTVFAADYTLTMTPDVTTGKAGEYVKILTTLDTNVGVKAMQFSITFDSADFEIADDPATVEDAEEYGPFSANYVPYDYWIEYSDVKSARKWGDATIGAEQRTEGYTVTFAYAKSSAVSTEVTDMTVGGAYLKVKGTTAKTSNITLTSVTIGDADGNAKEVSTNTIPFAITADVQEPTTATVTISEDENAVLKVTDSTGAEVATGATVDVGSVLTVTAKPKVGYKLSAQTGIDDTILGMGGTYNVTVNADTTISVTAEAITDAPVTIAAHYYDNETELDAACGIVYLFGKTSDTAAAYGIELKKDGADYTIPTTATYNAGEGPKFPANSANANGYFIISFHGLEAATYTAAAYTGETVAAGYDFIIE